MLEFDDITAIITIATLMKFNLENAYFLLYTYKHNNMDIILLCIINIV